MPPKKSSASSATRKKHARKAVGGAAEQLPLPKEKKKEKGGGKGKNKEPPRPKVFIPPSKPAPVQPDPIDRLGLASQLPPELLMVLRRLAKKDAITKRKAIEDLETDWVSKVVKGQDGADVAEAYLLIALPVWLHHVPSLFLHSSRRIRLLASNLHTALLQIASFKEQVIYFLQDVGSTQEVEEILGSWCMTTHDIDRQVALQAHKSWDSVVRISPKTSSNDDAGTLLLDKSALSSLTNFITRSLLDPSGVFLDLNPAHPIYIPPPALTPRKGPARQANPATPPSKRLEEEIYTRAKTEEEEESETDRKARFRTSALGVLRWMLETPNLEAVETSVSDSLLELLSKPLVWSSLQSSTSIPYDDSGEEAFGFNQVPMRKTAWTILKAILKNSRIVEHILPQLSSAVLRSAWVESDITVKNFMWEPLLSFLMKYPSAWTLDTNNQLEYEARAKISPNLQVDYEVHEDEDDEDDEDVDEVDNQEEEKDETEAIDKPSDQSEDKTSSAFTEFLTFMQLACSGSPVQGYPTVVVILSTIPPTFLGSSGTSWIPFFTSFWAALDGRALSSLDRSASSSAFLNSLLECLVFLIRRSIKLNGSSAAEAVSEETCEVVEQQFRRVIEELATGRLRASGDAAGKYIAKSLIALYAKGMPEALFAAAWEPFKSFATDGSKLLELKFPETWTRLLTTLSSQFENEPDLKPFAHKLVQLTARTTMEACSVDLKSEAGKVSPVHEVILIRLLEDFAGTLKEDGDLIGQLDELIHDQLHNIISNNSDILTSYLRRRESNTKTAHVWKQVLQIFASDYSLAEKCFPALLDRIANSPLPEHLKPEDDELDNLAGALVSVALSGQSEGQLSIVRYLLQFPNHFLSRRSASGLIHNIIYSFSEKVRKVLHDTSETAYTSRDLLAPLDLIQSAISVRPEVACDDMHDYFLSDIYCFAYLFPRMTTASQGGEDTSSTAFRKAEQIWQVSTANLDDDQKSRLQSHLKVVLKDLISSLDSKLSPSHILDSLSETQIGQSFDVFDDLFPSEEELDEMLSSLSSLPFNSLLAIQEPLAFRAIDDEGGIPRAVYDKEGFSEYGRIANALLGLCVADRHTMRSRMPLLRHFILLSDAAREILEIPTAINGFLKPGIRNSLLKDIHLKTQKVAALMLSSTIDDSWHRRITTAALNTAATDTFDPVGQFFVIWLRRVQVPGQDNTRESVALHGALQYVLSGATKDDADSWLTLSRRLERSAPESSLSILHSITKFAPEPAKLDRYRNELAAGALGIHPDKAGTEGLMLLRRFSAVAPDPESDVVYLSQQRAVNFTKACEQWIISDDSTVGGEVESEMTLIFGHLAPILQNVPGAHWDLIFDTIDNNLESGSFYQEKTLGLLARTFNLINIIRDLASTNKWLRGLWNDKELTIMKLVKGLVSARSLSSSQQKDDPPTPSNPRILCWELALSIVEDLPPSLIDYNTLSSMCHLLKDNSPTIKQMSYSLLHQAAKPRTEHLIIEAGVDNSSDLKLELPSELLSVVEESLNYDHSQESQDILGFLLGWMLVFDLFTDASLKVKIGYASQMRDLDLMSSNFMPTILNLLKDSEASGRFSPLDIWAVDEYFVPLYDLESPISATLLAAHLLYRSLLYVPSLIALWWSDCKDRQLSLSISNLVTRNFSPLLVATELAHVKDPDVVEELSGENWTVKVVNASNEVMISFLVDDQSMEIGVRLPTDYPLHAVEVRDVKRVGVAEKQWRGWLLAVKQIVASQNGRIVDGLSIFKKNVTHHFQDQTECAICYSIISATELSLPKKRCKTCKNRFHSDCLYKWFNTSHSSSCPLCRSDFI